MYVVRVVFKNWVNWEETEGITGFGSSEILEEVFISESSMKGHFLTSSCSLLYTVWHYISPNRSSAKVDQDTPDGHIFSGKAMCRKYMIGYFDEASYCYSLLSRAMNIWQFIVWFKEILPYFETYFETNYYLYQPQTLNHHHLRQFSRNYNRKRYHYCIEIIWLIRGILKHLNEIQILFFPFSFEREMVKNQSKAIWLGWLSSFVSSLAACI